VAAGVREKKREEEGEKKREEEGDCANRHVI